MKSDPNHYINRELSWLKFNQRVLNQAQYAKVPVLERLKFLAITSSNMDEFFMVRVGGLQLQQAQGIDAPDPSGGGDVVRATATAAASNTFTARMTALAFEHPDKDSNEYKEEAADIWRTPGRVQGRKDNVTAKEMRMAAAQQAGAKRKREEEV